MAGCIAVPSCVCGYCARCKARERMRYKRARDRGFAPPREICQCGECHLCMERERLRIYREQRIAAEQGGGEQAKPQSKRVITRQKKEAVIREWQERNEAHIRQESERPLSPKQRSEVIELIYDILGEG